MSMNPFSPSNTQTSEYLAHDKSPPKHLSAMTTIVIVHAILALARSVFSTLFQSAHSLPLTGLIMGYVSNGFLLLIAYLLYRRNKWAFIPALLYMLQRWILIYATYARFQSYFASHPGTSESPPLWQDSLFWLTTASSTVLPAVMGTIYTAYCLYQRKRGLLA